jgi:hypothetical protein
LLLRGCDGVVFTVRETCPVPVIEFGLTKHADSVRLAGIVHVRLISEVKPFATFTVTVAVAAEPTAAAVPGDDSAKLEMVIGTAVETDLNIAGEGPIVRGTRSLSGCGFQVLAVSAKS